MHYHSSIHTMGSFYLPTYLSMSRFLDLASKKGKTLIVIDGLNRLVNNEGMEDNLAWLPLEFPSNIRVILSVTTSPLVGMKSLVQAVKLMRKISMKSLAENIDDVVTAINHGVTIRGGGGGGDSEDDHQALLVGAITVDGNHNKGQGLTTEGQQGLEEKTSKDKSSLVRKSRILTELDRRKIPYLVMKPLKRPLCRSSSSLSSSSSVSVSLSSCPSSIPS